MEHSLQRAFNRLEYSDFTSSSGVNLDLSSGDATLQALGSVLQRCAELPVFLDPTLTGMPQSIETLGPRLGFAYGLTPNTVVRGGAGIYYGMNVATKSTSHGLSFWEQDGVMYFSQDKLDL